MYSLIFRGRSFELQKWRHLRVSVQNAFAFSFSTSSASVSLQDGRKGKNFTVSYLVDSLGLPAKLADSISRKVRLEDKGNFESVLNLFRSHGFKDSQISSIIKNYPRLLILDAEKTLGPKLKFLHSMKGASSSEFTEIVSTVPKILGKKGDKTLSVYYDFVRDVIEADKCSEYGMLCHSSLPQGNLENKIRNVSALRELGVPQRLLFHLLISHYQPVCGKEKFEESLKKVVEMGFDPTTSKFANALNVMYQLSDKTREEKVNVYKRLGFAVGDVWEMFMKCPVSLSYSEKKILNSFETFLGLGFTRDEFTMIIMSHPQCIGFSVEALKKKTEFLVNKMNWPLKAVVSYPQVLGCSMEKRIVPRCNVMKALMSKGLLGRSELPPISSVLAMTDQAFLNKYVKKHDDKELVLELMSIFTKGRIS